MTRFNLFDHDAALTACQKADEIGANATPGDIATLNRAAGAYAIGEPETLTRREFEAALARVRNAISAKEQS